MKNKNIIVVLISIAAFLLVSGSALCDEPIVFENDPDLESALREMNKKIAAKDWTMAVKIISNLLKNQKESYILLGTSEHNAIPICEKIVRDVLNLPEDVQAMLSKSVEPDIEKLAKNAYSISAWENIARLYIFCQGGIDASLRVAEQASEMGDFRIAQYWLERAIFLRKLTPDKYPQVFAHLSYCQAALGLNKEAATTMNLLKKLGNVTIESEGKKWDIARMVIDIETQAKILEKLFKAENKEYKPVAYLPSKKIAEVDVSTYYWFDAMPLIYKDTGEMPMIEQSAIVINDILYYSNAKSLRAYDIKQNKMAWIYGIKEDCPPLMDPAKKRFPLFSPIISPEGSMDVIYTGAYFIANLGQTYIDYGTTFERVKKPEDEKHVEGNVNSNIHAVTADGTKIWQGFGGNSDKNILLLKDTVFLNSPCKINNKLYLTGIAIQKIPSVYLFCFDANTGYLLWKNFLWTYYNPQPVNRGYMIFRMILNDLFEFRPLLCDDPSPVTDGSRIFISSGMGGIGAFDMESGCPQWVYKFHHEFPNTQYVYRNNNKTWIANKPALWNHFLLAAPSNSNFLFAFDKMTGEELWNFPRGTHNYFLGVNNGKAIITGENITAVDIKTGQKAWSMGINGKPFGRGCIYKGIIYHPTEKGIVLVDAETGRNIHTYEWQGEPWDKAGNISFSDNKIIVCGYKKITVYEAEEKK